MTGFMVRWITMWTISTMDLKVILNCFYMLLFILVCVSHRPLEMLILGRQLWSVHTVEEINFLFVAP